MHAPDIFAGEERTNSSPIGTCQGGKIQSPETCVKFSGQKDQTPVLLVHSHRLPFFDSPIEKLERQRIDDLPQQQPLEGPSAVHDIVASPCQVLLGPVREDQRDVFVLQPATQLLDLKFHNRRQLLGRQRVEDDDVVDAVQELRTEVTTQHL